MDLGIEIGGTKLQLVVGRDGKIEHRERRSVDKALGGEGIRGQIRQVIPSLGKFDAVGVGFGGPVNWRSGKIARSHQIEGWSDFELGSWLKELTGKPVRVDNDANTACLGEALLGGGKGKNPVFYVTLGSGVGGGLVVDGSIYHGATPGEAEIGHVRLDRAGVTVEQRCSGWAVDRRVREEMGETGGAEARFLVDHENPLAKRILREVAEDLAFGLSHVTQLMHPEVIVIGGGLSNLGEPLRAAVADALPRFVMGAFLPGPEVKLASLAEDAVPCGALLLARQART